MSELQLIILLAVVAWVGLIWLIARVLAFSRRQDDAQLDDMEQLVAVSQPAELERPHIRAGTAWWRNQQ